MNRILLPSSLPVCAAIIAAHEKGISNSEIFHLANSLEQLDSGRNLIATPFQIGQKMIAAKVSATERYHIASSKLTRGQIAYAIAKHQKQQKAAKKAITKKKNQKKTEIFAKLPTVRPSVSGIGARVAANFAAKHQKTIKFSAPLKVVTSTVSSFC